MTPLTYIHSFEVARTTVGGRGVGGSKWIHVSYVTYRKNRHQKLQCKDGKTYQALDFRL